MKNLFNFILSLTLLSSIILSGCGGNTTVPVMFSGSVSGIVVKDKNKEPIEGAKVSIGNRDFITKSDGMFKFDGVSFDNNFEITVEYDGQIKPIKPIVTDEAKKLKMLNIGMIYFNISETIYILGTSNKKPCYWIIKDKNKEKVTINEPDADVHSILVDKNKVYVCGNYKNNSDVDIPCYWIDGKVIELSQGNYGYAKSIFVNNNNIYIGGESSSLPCYWINDKNNLTEVSETSGSISSIFVDNNKVYTSGNILNNNKYNPCYWINKDYYSLSTNLGNAQSIFINNNKIYIAGNYAIAGTEYRPFIYIDGKLSELSSSHGAAYSIFIKNNIIYTGGYYTSGSKNIMCYWTGTTPNTLPGEGITSKIFVSDDTIYLTGYYIKDSKKIYGYWIINGNNQTFQELTDAESVDGISVIE